MMKPTWTLFVPWVLSLSITTASVAQAQPASSQEPEKIVRQMCDYLKSLKQFSYQAEVSYDQPGPDGNQYQYGFDVKASVRRPDRLRVDAEGDLVNKQFFFNGRTITLYDKNYKMYATMDVPPDIEEALDKAHKEFDLRVALTDLASPKLCDHLSNGQRGTRDLGMSKVRGIASHHVILDRKDIQVQVWIEAGVKPLPQKVVITEKKQTGSPQWTAYLDHWDVSPKLNETLFTFTAPPGVQRIQFLPAQKPASSKPEAPPSKKGGPQ
jgi:hypothetical protein